MHRMWSRKCADCSPGVFRLQSVTSKDHIFHLYNPQQHRAHAFRFGRDPGVVCRYYASVTL